MSNARRVAFAPLLSVLISACATSGGEPAGLHRCKEPRPQICTREYLPVCGQRKDGAWRTYGNDCDACADPNVVRRRPGACRPNE